MVDVATLRTLFTADYGSFEKDATRVEKRQKQLDGTKVTTTVDADVRDAERDLDDIQDALEDLHDTTAKPEVLPDTEAAEADLDEVRDALGDIDDTIARPRIDSEGLRDFRDEAQDTAREGAASFTGEFDDVADIIQETLANALVGFGPAGAVAGLALAAGVGIALSKLQEIADAANEGAEATAELSKSVVDAGGRVGNLDFGERIVDWSTQIADQREAWELWQESATTNLDEVRRRAELTGTSVEDLLGAEVGGDTAAADRVFEALSGRLQDVRRDLDLARESQQRWSDQQVEATGVADDMLSPFQDQILALQEQEQALTDSSDAIRDNARDLRSAQEASDIMRAATEGLTVQELQYRDALEEANGLLAERSGNARDATRAQLDLADQVAEANRILTETDETTGALLSTEQDRQRALLDLAEQILTTSEANEEAEGTTHAYNQTLADNIQSFYTAAAAAGITGEAAEELAVKYGLIPKNVTTTIEADTTPARVAVERLIKDVSGRTIGIQVGSVSTGIRAFADGGRPPVGVPSLVGEEGVELFVPDVAGTIIPAGRTAQMLNTNTAPSGIATQSWSRADLDYLADRIGQTVLAGARAVTAGMSASQDATALYLDVGRI